MTNILNKLWASKSTLSIILWIAVFAYAYSLDYTKKPTIIKSEQVGRSIEEIIATPVDKAPDPSWDNDFKSTVEAVQ